MILPSPLRFAASLFLICASVVRADWNAPVNFTNLPEYEVGPRCVRETAGNIHLVWYGGAADSGDWEIWYQKWNASSGWTAPVAISQSGAAGPDIAIDGANNLHVVWHGGGNPEDIYYRKATGGVWGATTNLSNSAHRSLNPRLAVNAAGTSILVAWHESDQTAANWDILARPFASGTWQAVENPSNDSGLSRTVDVKIDAAGNFHLGWEDLDTENAYYRKRTAGVYGTKIALDATSGRSLAVTLAVAPNGHIHAAWHNDDGDWEIFHRKFDGTSWGAITNVSNRTDPAQADNTAILLVDANNNAHVVWHDYKRVYYTHTVSGVWRPVYDLYAGNAVGSPQLVLGQTTSQLHCIFASRDAGTWDCFHMFCPIPDTTPPGPVTNFRTTPSNAQNKLEWSMPPALDRAGVRIRWKTTGFPTSATDGTLLADIADNANPNYKIDHIGLVNGTTYYYAAFAYDTEPNYSTLAQASGRPTSAPKPNLLVNGPMESFSGGVAAGWTTYKMNDPNNALTFGSDNGAFHTSTTNPSTLSQGIMGIDSASLPATGYTSAGVRQTVAATPGKVYLFVGFQDLSLDTSPAGDRYIHDFGINVLGDTDPGLPNYNGSVGNAKWMTPAQALHNNNSGGSPRFGGFHRARAAFVAQSGSITVWSGVSINNAGPRDDTNRFNMDANFLFEFDFPIEATLQNPGFEGTITDLQDEGDTLPDHWLPAGGALGTTSQWAVGTFWARSGVNGVRVWSRRGTVNAGLMQRVAAVPGSGYTFSVYGVTSGENSTAMSVGIDPAGGGDLTSPNIVWSLPSTAGGGAIPNTLLSVTANAQSSAITVFMRTTSTNSTGTDGYQWSDFDDAALTGSAGGAVFVPRGSTWRFHDADTDIGHAWRAAAFDDSAWADGPAELGFGDAPATPINDNGGTPRPMSARFRHTFNVANPALYAALNLAVQRDDGAVVYLNGVEVWRTNMPTGEVVHGTPASIATPDETTFFTTTIEPGFLVAGDNVLAVEVHQNADTSSDLSFDLELTATNGNPDTDGDGLPDVWETNNLGNLTQPGDADTDGDGASNAAELAARTHPAQPGSRFAITSITRAANGNVTITWPTHAGLLYRIRYADGLQNWITLPTTFTGTGGTLTWTDDGLESGSPPALEPRRFYQAFTGP